MLKQNFYSYQTSEKAYWRSKRHGRHVEGPLLAETSPHAWLAIAGFDARVSRDLKGANASSDA